MNVIDKIVNVVRISPHGIIPIGIAAGASLDMIFNLGLHENLPRVLQTVEEAIPWVVLPTSPSFAYNGLNKYRKFKKRIEERGLDKRHVETNLKWYCDRQAYKAAAYSCGAGDEFNGINEEYEGARFYTWMPEI